MRERELRALAAAAAEIDDEKCATCGHFRYQHDEHECQAVDRWGPRPDQVHDRCSCEGFAA